jgi:hypothetical protein
LGVILPFDRARLALRNTLDDAEERDAAASLGVSGRALASLGLSELVRELSRAAGTQGHVERQDELAEKARLYVLPLRILASRQ